MSVSVITIVVLASILGLAVVLYNGLVRLRAQVDNGWSQIQVQLQRRSDLVPNLVETVKGYAAHERETLDAVIQARNSAAAAHSVAETAAEGSKLQGALGRIFALAESYPQLKADANFRQLQEELTATEDRIAYARQFYNDSVTRYNTRVQTFPVNLVAGLAKFAVRDLFDASPGSEDPVKVSF